MDAFLKYFYQDMGILIKAFVTVFTSAFDFILKLINFPMRIKLIEDAAADFTMTSWILVGVTNLLLIVIIGLAVFFIGKGIRRIFRFNVPAKENDKLREEVAKLNREVFKLNYEKDKILAMKVAELGMNPNDQLLQISDEAEAAADEELGEEMSEEDALKAAEDLKKNRNTVNSPPVIPEKSRFFRLTTVDNYYKTEYQAPEYDNDISLPEFCDRWRSFAASRLRLFYDISILRFFVASMGACRLIILQGISGTGKTSLPYMMGKYFENDSTIASVQPSWRDRTELFGYFNEFTKKFNETEVLRRIYESGFNDDINIIILDEMNIARVEYYFAEMLSILEMPDPAEWKIELVPSSWDSDPHHLIDCKLQIPQNVWYVGTANNDDSTFAVSDKVYDRAFVINLDTKGVPFDAPVTESKRVPYSHVAALYDKAVAENPVSDETLEKVALLDNYVIEKFRVAFGNRIMKQLKIFLPVYVACGGSEYEALDYLLATKVFRKFESLNLSLIRDEIKGLIMYMDTLFGKEVMGECYAFLRRLQRTF